MPSLFPAYEQGYGPMAVHVVMMYERSEKVHVICIVCSCFFCSNACAYGIHVSRPELTAKKSTCLQECPDDCNNDNYTNDP